MRSLTKPELDLLASLAPLVGTPREAKRLTNLYRMIRSTRNLRPAARFLGDERNPGDYQAVVVLLGLLSGHGRLLVDVLTARPRDSVVRGGLMHRSRRSTWQEFAAGIAPQPNGDGSKNNVVGPIDRHEDVAEWQRLHDGLVTTTALVQLRNLDAFHYWAPEVARFSFLLTPEVADLRASQ